MTDGIVNEQIDAETACGMLFFFRNISDVNPALGRKFSPLTGVIESSILPSVKIIADGIYISREDDTADVMLSLRTGLLIMTIAPNSETSDTVALGRELINSILNLADEQGFLPIEVSEGDEGEALIFGSIGPETVYPPTFRQYILSFRRLLLSGD